MFLVVNLDSAYILYDMDCQVDNGNSPADAS